MNILFILNEAPYGDERSYNALRLAKALVHREDVKQLTVFLMADAVTCAKQGQHPPQGYYNIDVMLHTVIRHGSVLLCGTCMDARGIGETDLVEGARRSTMDELANLCIESDKQFVF